MQRSVESLREETFDLLVLGGGITGAGVALDASLRGYRVALIDKGDFASGTSSVSSKLIHGGLRYLEHADFHLVYEALQERRLLLRNAAHLVHPLRFIIPYCTGARVRRWQWRAALSLYDLLAGRRNLHRGRPLSARALGQAFPDLLPRGLLGGAAYFDAQMDDARLCLEVIASAARLGCRVANYVEAVSFELREGVIRGVRVRDRIGKAEFSMHARQVLNATGPWTDAICRLAGDATGPHLQPTKGVHVIAPGRGLLAAFLLLHPRDGRVFFVIPWMGKTLLGTTDTFTDEPPDGLTVQPEEVDYLLEGHNRYFAPALQVSDLLGSFAGLRPLLRARPRDPSSRSREFQVFFGPSGLMTVAGGKYTTYRRMAEVLVDQIARRLGRRCPCRTHTFLLEGTPRVPWLEFVKDGARALVARHGLDESRAHHLLLRYGRHADDVAAYLDTAPALAQSVVAGEPDLAVEFAYQRDHEMALFPADHLLRRTRLGLLHPALLREHQAGAFQDAQPLASTASRA